MNSTNSTQLCRLCLETGAGLVNVFEQFEDSTIASVLATHYWFQINKDDGMPEWICETCWTHTKTFHHFYKRLELRHQKHLIDEIKRERSISPIEEGLAADFVVDKYEEESEITEDTKDSHILSEGKSCDKDIGGTTCDKSEAEQTTDDEDQPSHEKPIKGHGGQSKMKEQDEEIRRFFKMTCEMCSDVGFDTLKTMRKHYEEVHRTTGYLLCCGSKFKFRYRMLEHIRYHANPAAHLCKLCGKSFCNNDSLKVHEKTHAPLNLKCEFCSKTYATAKSLENHVLDKHPADTSVKFHCDVCGKSFQTKLSLYNHINYFHVRKHRREHVCERCGRAFTNKADLKHHMEMKHSTTPPPRVQCDICGAWSNNRRNLMQHLRNQHQEKQDGKVFKCPICKKDTQSKRLLKKHIREIHTGRKHQCTFCDKSFKRPKVLQEHIALHTGVDLYTCTYCDRTFKSNANMYSHRKKAHLAEWTRDRTEKLKLK